MKKILVIDDDQLIHFYLSRILKNLSDEIDTVATGSEAIERVDRTFYALCFLDINLPDIHGLDLMGKIVEKSPATKIVVMSGGHVSDEAKEKIYERAYIFLAKPLDIYMVRKIVTNVMNAIKA